MNSMELIAMHHLFAAFFAIVFSFSSPHTRTELPSAPSTVEANYRAFAASYPEDPCPSCRPSYATTTATTFSAR